MDVFATLNLPNLTLQNGTYPKPAFCAKLTLKTKMGEYFERIFRKGIVGSDPKRLFGN